MSLVTAQLLDFLQFVVIGIFISLVFDFFRAYRGVRKINNFMVFIQDFIYFFLITAIIVFSIIYILDSSLRFYIFIAIILGISIYISMFSQIFLKIYHKFFDTIAFIFDLFILPLKLCFQVITKIYIFLKKCIKKCCKMFFYVISFICNGLQKLRLPNIKSKEEVW